MGTGKPTLLAPSRAYQLAKIDPDTGLQENVGPSINRVITVSLQRAFSQGSLFISYSQADARDRANGEPVPEAPRLIWMRLQRSTGCHFIFALNRGLSMFELNRLVTGSQGWRSRSFGERC
jgi:hypothetical protein